MTRKAIQIMFHQVAPLREAKLIALCNNGSIWELSVGRNQWDRCPDIPATDPPRRIAGSFPEGTGA